MAVPSYTTDLTPIDTANTTTNWSEPGAPETGGGTPQNGTEFFIEGTACVSKACAGVGGISGGVLYNALTGLTIAANDAVYIWLDFAAPNTLLDRSAGGFAVCIGNLTTAYRKWYVLGKDNYAYGGWVCVAVDPAVAGSVDIGTPNMGTRQYFGAVVKTSATISKGEPFGVDVIRHGRTLQIIEGSEVSGSGTFAGAAAANDEATAARWGIFQAIAGGYQLQGRFLLGTAATAVDFRDSNTSILIANTLFVSAGFNVIEIRNASSRVDWTSVSFQALGTVSRGDFVVTNNATVNLTGCSFTDMGTFGFLAASTLLNVTFRRCQLVTQASAVITNCRFESATGAVALLSNNPAAITGTTFVSDGTGHAIEINTAGTYAVSGCTFTNYAPTGTPGTSGNEVIYNNSSGNVIINASGCVGTITYKNGTSATTTVNQTITLTLTGLVTGSDIVILNVGTTTERVNVDSNSGTTYAYGYADSGSSIDVGVFKAGYVPFYIRAYTLAATAASLPCAQVLDRNYLE